MANKPSTSGSKKFGWKQSVKPALVLSLVFGVVAGVISAVAGAGRTRNGLNFQLGAIFFLVAFVAGLLVISLLMMVAKDNPEDLGKGSGVNRSSELTDAELDAIEARERAQRARQNRENRG